MGGPAAGLRPRVAGVDPVDAEEDLVLEAGRLALVDGGGGFSGESDKPKLSPLKSMSWSWEATTSMLPTIVATVGKGMAAVGVTALQLP